MMSETSDLIFYLIPSIVLLLGGSLFILFKDKLWNNPLYVVFRNDREIVNVITGRIWILGSILSIPLLIWGRAGMAPYFVVGGYLLFVIASYGLGYFVIRRLV